MHSYGLLCFWTIFALVVFIRCRARIRAVVIKYLSRSRSSYSISIEDGLAIVTFLFRIRCAELFYSYRLIRHYQEKAGSENWVCLFLKDYIQVSEDHWGDHDEKKMKVLEKKAKALFEERYNFSAYSLGDFDSREIASVRLALLFWEGVPDRIVQKLRGVQTFGVLIHEIEALIAEYKSLGSGGFQSVFGCRRRLTPAHHSLHRIDQLWSLIFEHLKVHIVVCQDRSPQQPEDLHQLLEEIGAAEELARWLDVAIRRKNAADAEESNPSPHDEETVMESFKKSDLSKVGL